MPNFVSRVGKFVRVDIDADAASGTAHVIFGLEVPNRLRQLMPTFWTLKGNYMSVDSFHLSATVFMSPELFIGSVQVFSSAASLAV